MLTECVFQSELALGGQKTVCLAKHPVHGLVVIKKGIIRSFTSLERIKREVELLSELNSEFFPQQFYFNIDVKNKEFTIVEEYIEGTTLRDGASKLTNPTEIFKLLNLLVDGLSVIWDKNIVHRDLKPENIIIRPDGRPCVIDLGIARFLDLESLTKTIAPVGPCTPIYASPEQLKNHKNQIDHRTDFFTLGIIALELFLGLHPFDPDLNQNQFSIVENILQGHYMIKTEIVKEDKRMTDFALKTLGGQPYQRFRTYQDMKKFLN